MMYFLQPPVKPRAIQVCLFLVRLLLLSICWLVLLIGVAWAFGALWFDFPVSALRRPLAVVFGLSAIGALLFVRPHWRAQLGVAGAITLVAVWWLSIRPSNTRNWQPEVAEAPYAEIDGDRVGSTTSATSTTSAKPTSDRNGKPRPSTFLICARSIFLLTTGDQSLSATPS
jgi:hypothetical protein